MFGLIAVVFYFFMIRPQMKRNKETRKFRESLAVGDKIITAGGIHGKILEVSDTTVLITSEGTKLRLEKNSIVMNPEDALGNQQK
ncbi:MAG: preprotein translocase subunit YajC [Crocinitomicaceae bacterium]|nr:preprotein translocase subunit YajC [Crocinitomicaceae bacterium]